MAAVVRELTDGEGVAAVYDPIGQKPFFPSLDSLRPHGVMVTFGNASGPVKPFAPSELAKRHSLYVTRPIRQAHIDLEARKTTGSTVLIP